MSETAGEFAEERVPLDGIEATVEELVELYGGELKASRAHERDFIVPLRRGVASAGGVECTIAWAESEDGGLVTLTVNREVDAPKLQRVLFLTAGVIGSVMFMLWPFFPFEKRYGTLAFLGGAIAFAVYVMTLRKTSGGIAYDFLRRVADRQRVMHDSDTVADE
jgi:hypothetical protein